MKKSIELAGALLEVLEENMKLQIRINRVCDLLKEFDYDKNNKEALKYFISEIIDYLGDKENGWDNKIFTKRET